MANIARLLLPLACALALVPSALARGDAVREPAGASDVPQGVHGFLLRSNDTVNATHTFSRTPAFAWEHVPGAQRYQFQLSTSARFADNALVLDQLVKAPVFAPAITLPWITGAPYSWFVRVRAIVGGVEGPWSQTYGFNLRAPSAPRSLSSGENPQPGMVRWTPVEGATAYQVSLLLNQGAGQTKLIKTATTAADLREYYTLHNDSFYVNLVFWRVRAVREVFGEAKNKLPAVSYGPWSARFRTVEPALTPTPIALGGSISRSADADVVSITTSGAPGPGPHVLAPGFWWSGMAGPTSEPYGPVCPVRTALAGVTCPLYHVYVFTDPDCVNRVHVSDLVGSPAYVPRLTLPLDLPKDFKQLEKAPGLWLGDGKEGNVFDAGNDAVRAAGVKDDDAASSAGSSSEGDGTEEPAAEEPTVVAERQTGLWDADWPSGRYYWTVVPAVPTVEADDSVEYHDVAFAQDMCAEGRVMAFGKTSEIATASASGVPFLSGLSPTGLLVAATEEKPTFFGKVVVAWKTVPSAQTYEVQWSRSATRWRTAGSVETPATQAVIDLPAGRWHYRVRGRDRTLPGLPGLSWSDPIEVSVSAPKFTVVGRTKR